MKDKEIKQEFAISLNIVLTKYNDIKGKTKITLPNDITIIGESAFECSSLASIVITNSIKYIRNYAFSGCYNLKNITLSENLIEIAYAAFRYCNKLFKVTIPNSVISVGEYAFTDNTNLTSVTLSNKLEEIGRFAFSKCNLESITLPDSIKFIGYKAFDDYIKNINLYSYRVFSILPDNLKITALLSTIKNYYTGKIKYSDDDMKLFKEYIRENKYELFRYVKDNVELINFMLESMGENFITHKDAFDLVSEPDENNVEVNALLMEYIHKNYNTGSKSIESIIDNKFDLGEFNEEIKVKKLKKGE